MAPERSVGEPQGGDGIFSQTESNLPSAPRPSSEWLWLGLKALIGLLLIASAAGLVAFGARHFATTSDRFAIHELQAEGNRRFTAEALAQLGGVKRGDNLFATDELRVQRALLEDPWIASAKVTRKLPSTLVFEVEEYSARALAAIGEKLYLVTRDGHPIDVAGPNELDFPVVTGVTVEEIAADRLRAKRRIAHAVGILQRYEQMPMAASYAPQELHLSDDDAVTLVVGRSGVSLQLGTGNVRQRLQMAARILSRVRSRGEVPSVVFLDNEAHPERVVVRLR